MGKGGCDEHTVVLQHPADLGKVRAFFMKRVGFPLHSKWTSAEYLCFLNQNGWTVRKSAVLKASFPLTYAACVKLEV